MGLAGVCVSTCALNEIEEPLHPVKKKKKKRDRYHQRDPNFSPTLSVTLASHLFHFLPFFLALPKKLCSPNKKNKNTNVCSRMHVGVSMQQKRKKKNGNQ
jgi:hypothetical protein